MVERGYFDAMLDLIGPKQAEAAPLPEFLKHLARVATTAERGERFWKALPEVERAAVEALHEMPSVRRAPLYGGTYGGDSMWIPPQPENLLRSRIATPGRWLAEAYPEIPYEQLRQGHSTLPTLGGVVWNRERGINPIHVGVHETGGHAMMGPIPFWAARRAGIETPMVSPFNVSNPQSAIMEGFAENFANSLVPSTGRRRHYRNIYRGTEFDPLHQEAGKIGMETAQQLKKGKTADLEKAMDMLMDLVDQHYRWRRLK